MTAHQKRPRPREIRSTAWQALWVCLLIDQPLLKPYAKPEVTPLGGLRTSLRAYFQARIKYLSGEDSGAGSRPPEWVRELEAVEQAANDLIVTSFRGATLAHETGTRPPGQSRTHPYRGFSRNPFRRVSRSDADWLALGAVAYLLRGSAFFFRNRKDPERLYNLARRALNDLYQASQLAWRLYHSLSCHHHRPRAKGLISYFQAVEADSHRGSPGRSAYFVCQLLVLSEIFRARIYRALNDLENADRHYRRAERRLRRLLERSRRYETGTASRRRFLVPPTLIRGLYERSKIRFDLGYVLHSLATQVAGLAFLVETSEEGAGSVRQGLVARLRDIERFLIAESGSPTFHRQRVFEQFVQLQKLAKGQTQHIPLSSCLSSIASCLPSTAALLVVSLMARIGFTLFTMAPPRFGQPAQPVGQLLWFFRFDRVWNTCRRRANLQPSHLGLYCETLFASPRVRRTAARRPEGIERAYAFYLRQSYSQRSTTQNSPDASFFRDILLATTKNVGNIVTIPRRNSALLMRRGYFDRRLQGDLALSAPAFMRRHRRGRASGPVRMNQRRLALNKLVVLRRWQSFAPIVPRSSGTPVRGGGYLLIWHGKGIAVDPGFGFIQNLYDQGFSLEDIHAVVVTHSHPDHDNDFANLITLAREWNDYHRTSGQVDRVLRWDLILNESSNHKFAAWLQASSVEYARIMPLPIVSWQRDTKEPEEGPFRGENAVLDLSKTYHLKIEAVPAWHDDVISRTAAVGLKFHLLAKSGKRTLGIVGYTGDTGAYGHKLGEAREPNKMCLASHYRECAVLVAHLGDVRLRELTSAIDTTPAGGRTDGNPVLLGFLQEWFAESLKGGSDQPDEHAYRQRVGEFVRFGVSLGLLSVDAMMFPVSFAPQQETGGAAGTDGSRGRRPGSATVAWWLAKYVDDGETDALGTLGWESQQALKRLQSQYPETMPADWWAQAEREIEAIPHHVKNMDQVRMKDAYTLLAFVCACSAAPWQYRYHLGTFGLLELFRAMLIDSAEARTGGAEVRGAVQRVFVVGELPEELTSYRHKIAVQLNRFSDAFVAGPRAQRRARVCALTGDVGLHVHLGDGKTNVSPRIRCEFCNYNKELVEAFGHYHWPHEMHEIALKREHGALIYLCATRDHFQGRRGLALYYLSHTERQVV